MQVTCRKMTSRILLLFLCRVRSHWRPTHLSFVLYDWPLPKSDWEKRIITSDVIEGKRRKGQLDRTAIDLINEEYHSLWPWLWDSNALTITRRQPLAWSTMDSLSPKYLSWPTWPIQQSSLIVGVKSESLLFFRLQGRNEILLNFYNSYTFCTLFTFSVCRFYEEECARYKEDIVCILIVTSCVVDELFLINLVESKINCENLIKVNRTGFNEIDDDWCWMCLFFRWQDIKNRNDYI